MKTNEHPFHFRVHGGPHVPALALESTVISHGLPYPQNLRTALRLEEIARDAGALPATIGILAGQVVVGLVREEIEHLATAADVRKVSRRDLPVVRARELDGATTVATTAWAAHRAGIQVFATGGIGGVHRGGSGKLEAGNWKRETGNQEPEDDLESRHALPGTEHRTSSFQPPAFSFLSADISADLPVLAQTPIIVLCAGAKAILDLPATLEWLETYGVTVVGYGTDRFPAFYNRDSGLPVDVRADTPHEVASLFHSQRELGLPGGLLVTVPVPPEHELPATQMEEAIAGALAEAEGQGIRGRSLTPFLLARVSELTGAASLAANLALLENNVRIGAMIAVALAG